MVTAGEAIETKVTQRVTSPRKAIHPSIYQQLVILASRLGSHFYEAEDDIIMLLSPRFSDVVNGSHS